MKNFADNIAVTGISGIFPGAHTIDQFAENIMACHEAIVDVPDHRWVIPPDQVVSTVYQPDAACSRRAGLVEGFSFDPDGFLIDRNLAAALDPVHQMVLHAGRQALESCSHTPEIRQRTGVILAAISLPTQAASDISRRIIMGDTRTISRTDIFSAGVVSVPASILARSLGFSGGSYTLDAACASSLFAVKLACRELTLGRADMMVAGGVSRPDSLYTQVGFTQLKALSPTGRCAPFDKSANGLVVGEGAGIIVLKRLRDAVAAGDRIWGVIQGAGWSNDIGGNLVAPASDGQIRAMAVAFKNAGWLPGDIQHLECHGSATPVGDNIELNSMKTLWSDAGCANAPCAIGSIKSMTGHLLTAAGAAGLIKTLVAMDRQQLPPSLHFKEPTAQSPLYETGFRVQTSPEPWKAKVPRAGVSGFGFGGINAHVLVEGYQPKASRQFFQPGDVKKKAPVPIAIVGMATLVATANTLEKFKKQVFGGRTRLPETAGQRWRVMPSDTNNIPEIKGFWINQVTTFPGEFHLPPNQVPDLLPQHLIMLKAARDAMQDAGFSLRPGKDQGPRTGFGAAIGIEFDFGAADFHLRWSVGSRDDSIPDLLSPPLTANRTLGALGGIVASRIAREFKLGGPCFTVSAQAASGLKAVEIGVNCLQSGETDVFLCGAVDMAGDLRQTLLTHGLTPFPDPDETLPFDKKARGSLPSEGACALILKPLDQALKDKDRIYSIIRGTASAGPERLEPESAVNSNQIPCEPPAQGAAHNPDRTMADAYRTSLESCLAHGNVAASSVGFYEAHGGADPMDDAMELDTLECLDFDCAVGNTRATCGDTGAAAGLLSTIKASLALFHHILPPIPGFDTPVKPIDPNSAIHFPKHPVYWAKKGKSLPRRALVTAMTRDRNVAHLLLEEVDSPQQRLTPLGEPETALFITRADSTAGLVTRLLELDDLVDRMIQKVPRPSCHAMGAAWFRQPQPSTGHVLSILANNPDTLKHLIQMAIQAVQNNQACQIDGSEGIVYTLNPMGQKGRMAFLYPGSGNHFPDMGRQIGVLFPEILDQMNPRKTTQACNLIYSQVLFGDLMTRVARTFGLTPQAGIGHSLGETASLFSLGVWNDPDEMLARMEQSDLFTEKLAGKFLTVKQCWNLGHDETPDWAVAAVNRSAHEVEAQLYNHERVYLLIRNTPDETVIGGSRDSVNAVIKALGCGAMFLEGVIAVHCPIAKACSDAYRDLHKFTCTPVPGIDFYSCARAARYSPTTETAAQSIVDQAVRGFDYVRLINQAWEDGVRVFVEMGPGSSCTRAVGRILEDRPHLVLSLSSASTGDDDLCVLLKGLATLAAHNVELDPARLFYRTQPSTPRPPEQTLSIPTARSRIDSAAMAALCAGPKQRLRIEASPLDETIDKVSPPVTFHPFLSPEQKPCSGQADYSETQQSSGVKRPALLDSARLTARAHEAFLALTQTNMQAYEVQFAALARAAAETRDQDLTSIKDPSHTSETDIGQVFRERPSWVKGTSYPPVTNIASSGLPEPLFDRDRCLEFARGRAGKVLGKTFDVIDAYPVRVRLPDDPLMLVDRIMSIEGEMLSMGPGRIVTQHDVVDNAWYLDGGKTPVSITIEAGQADLFLCSWLGIDHQVQGRRRYRLLDAKVTFHRDLPCPGETIEYHIEIDRFLKQGDIHLFFFHYRGYVNNELLISMREGCAGFFTPEEVENSGGIILTARDRETHHPQIPWDFPVQMVNERYDDVQINALRRGRLDECFGPLFKGIVLGRNMRLPGERMHLLDRVTAVEPRGGRFGLGRITAEADIQPDDWFLTCHFIDDKVMPGTLMYECCAHTLRIFTQRMGWISTNDDIHYDVVPGIESDLKCRGPVTVHTRKARYEIEIKEMGYNPEPYVIADAHMFSDNHRIVLYKNMGLKIAGLSRLEIERTWS